MHNTNRLKNYLTKHFSRTNHILTSKRRHKYILPWHSADRTPISVSRDVWQVRITFAFAIMWKKVPLKAIICSQISPKLFAQLPTHRIPACKLVHKKTSWKAQPNTHMYQTMRMQSNGRSGTMSSRQILGPQLKTTGLSLPPLNPWKPVLLAYKIIVKQIWRKTLGSRPQKAQNKTSERVSDQKPLNIVHAPHKICTKPLMNIMDHWATIIPKKPW